MSKLIIFTDGSVNPKTKVGYGASLLLSKNDLTSDNIELEKIKNQVKVKKFENTSSTKLELQTVLWSLEDIKLKEQSLTLYTDSQNIIGLPTRQKHFEKNGYLTNNKKLINNYELYQLFYKAIEHLDIRFVKVKGHKKSSQKTNIDMLFTLVDRGSRKALRNS